jgi:hypothetical protein
MPNEPDPIDAHLASPAQRAMREVVRSLPEETPSMAWRSGLNEALLTEANRRRRRVFWFSALRPAAGLAFAGALAAFFVLRSAPMTSQPPTSYASSSIEAELLTTHNQVAAFADVAGTGVRPIETTYASRTQSTDDLDWTEVDIDSL